MPKMRCKRRTRALGCVSTSVLTIVMMMPATYADSDPEYSVTGYSDTQNNPGIEFRSTQRSSAAHGGSPSVGGGSGGGSAGGSADNAPAVPAASGGSDAPGGSSRGGRAAGGPLEMVCTGEREGIPGSAARPGDAGAASSHCQYVPGTAPTTPADEGEPADEGGAGEGEAPSTETIVRTALARVPVSGASLSVFLCMRVRGRG